MRILTACDSFKGCLSSAEVAAAVRQGVLSVVPSAQFEMVSVADGGEGTVEAVTGALGGKIVSVTVSDPLGRPVRAEYGLCGDTAVMEMSAASGLPLLAPEERNPMLATTFGTGEMIADALSRGCRRFLVGIGGSATNDGGTGMLAALGYRFMDACGNVLEPTGGNMAEIVSIDDSCVNPLLIDAHFTVACDVDAVFCGKCGAAYIFAPQKGASVEQVKKLDAGLSHLATVILSHTGRDVRKLPGAGAAGGIGGAFHAFLDAELRKGIDMVLDAIDFDSYLSDVDMVVTGEGSMDAQTLLGKTPFGILQRAKAHNIPVIGIAGKVSDRDTLLAAGFSDIQAVTPPDMPLELALQPDVASSNIAAAIRRILSSPLPFSL